MSSTSVNIGIDSDSKVSSRVLKPPGGGHTDIFAPPQETVVKPRAKNNQQNSTMMGEIMGKAGGAEKKESNGTSEAASQAPKVADPPRVAEPVARARVPPGGFSSGLW